MAEGNPVSKRSKLSFGFRAKPSLPTPTEFQVCSPTWLHCGTVLLSLFCTSWKNIENDGDSDAEEIDLAVQLNRHNAIALEDTASKAKRLKAEGTYRKRAAKQSTQQPANAKR